MTQAARDEAGGRALAAMTAEMRLVALCCRWPVASEVDIAAAAARPIDWQKFKRLVRRHRVAGLVVPVLIAADLAPPHAVMSGLVRSAARTTRENGILATESARLQDLFAAHGVDALLIKGAALAQLAYGSVLNKHAKDIDMLVAPAALRPAITLLRGEGYELVAPLRALSDRQFDDVIRYSRDVALVHRDGRTQVELHWGLTDNPRILPGMGLQGRYQSVELGKGGAVVRTLAPDDLFNYLCVHGAAHGWLRLKWLADLAALLSHETPEGIERLYRAAAAQRVGDCAGQALLLAEALLGLELPAPLAVELRSDRRIRRLVAVAWRIMLGGEEREIGARRFGQARLIYARMLLSRDWRDFAVNVAGHMTAMEDVLALQLPRPLHLLYPVLRGPMWLARRAGLMAGATRRGKADD